jgi:predicted RNA binding protein YcfA (HicA-like mRNA interferase family)
VGNVSNPLTGRRLNYLLQRPGRDDNIDPSLPLPQPSLRREEVGQHGGTAVGEHAADCLGAVVQAGVRGDLVEGMTGACLGIGAATGEKAAITPKGAVKKLREMVGLTFDAHGGKHDKWRTATGRRVDFPRHARDLTPGTLKNIIKQAGLDLSIDEFIRS